MAEIEIKDELRGRDAEMFREIKKRLGCKDDQAVIEHLINWAYEKER